MAKQVTIKSGQTFDTLGKAEKHFGDIRIATQIGAKLAEPDRSDALDVYFRYCAATNWQAVDAVDVIADWDNRKRPAGNHAQTKALYVVDASGERHVFSIDKALAAIAV
jgi:hypothetical protein